MNNAAVNHERDRDEALAATWRATTVSCVETNPPSLLRCCDNQRTMDRACKRSSVSPSFTSVSNTYDDNSTLNARPDPFKPIQKKNPVNLINGWLAVRNTTCCYHWINTRATICGWVTGFFPPGERVFTAGIFHEPIDGVAALLRPIGQRKSVRRQHRRVDVTGVLVVRFQTRHRLVDKFPNIGGGGAFQQGDEGVCCQWS